MRKIPTRKAGNISIVGKIREVSFIDKKEIEKEIEQIDMQIDIAKRDVINAPDGRLRIAHKRGTEQYYLVSEDSDNLGKYISKKNADLIRSLAQKDYACKTINYMKKKKKMLESMRDMVVSFDDDKIYNKLNDSRKKLISPYYIPDDDYIKNWLSESFETKAFEEEEPEILTERGERVRSKSEKIIADKLLMLGVPYKYEHPIVLIGVGTVYPDFTLLDIKKRENVLLEHFGMMDNPTYCENAIRKINSYQKNGYYEGENILYTFETLKNPINIKNFENVMRNRFGI